MPAVSVLMPVYNGEQWLPRAVESVLAQTYTDFELVVIDDGSTDGSAGVVESFAARDPRVRLVRTAHAGVRTARRISLVEARAELVAFLDADDEWVPHRLERQLPFVDQQTVVFADSFLVVGGERLDIRYADWCRPPDVSYPATGVFPDLLSRGCFIWTGTVLAPRALLLEARVFRDADSPALQQGAGSDWEAWLLLALRGTRFHYVDEPLAVYHRRPGSVTADWLSVVRAMADVLEGLLPAVRGRDRRLVRSALRERRELLEVQFRKRGWRRLVAGDTRVARRELIRSWRFRPSSPRAWLALGLSLYPPLARRVVRGRV